MCDAMLAITVTNNSGDETHFAAMSEGVAKAGVIEADQMFDLYKVRRQGASAGPASCRFAGLVLEAMHEDFVCPAQDITLPDIFRNAGLGPLKSSTADAFSAELVRSWPMLSAFCSFQRSGAFSEHGIVHPRSAHELRALNRGCSA